MFRKILPYLISFIIGAVIVIIVIFAQHIADAATMQVRLQIWSDAFFVAGVILAGVGLLIYASNGGAFDMLAFGVYLFFNLFRRDVNKRKYKDFYEYRESKKDRDRPMAYMLLVGLGFILVAGIILIVYHRY